ncbi:hypothetical protein N9204_00380 [bacterium]|nr:hypothetical protein [bacterium]
MSEIPTFSKGQRLSHVELNRMGDGIRSLMPSYGVSRTTNGTHKGRRLTYATEQSTAVDFSGIALDPAGNRTTGLTDATKPWLRYDKAGPTITEQTGPPAEPWGNQYAWRRKVDFAGFAYF